MRRMLRFVRTFLLSSETWPLAPDNIPLAPFLQGKSLSRIHLLFPIFCTLRLCSGPALYFLFFILTGCSPSDSSSSLQLSSFSEIRSLFDTPPSRYRTAPLWVWNDDMTESQIDEQLTDFRNKGFGGVFVHPRPGLITPYLSDAWFNLFKYTVDRGKELGLYVWIYDENSYPSGFAGGHVPAEMPESYSQGQGLVMTESDILPNDLTEYFLVLKKTGDAFEKVTGRKNQGRGGHGPYYLFRKTFYGKSGWYGGYSYVDLLLNGVTDKFIELTMTGYEKTSAADFGQTVPGVFTDEPQIQSSGGIRWTPDLFEAFEKKWGYGIMENLPCLWLETGDWKQIRHNYYSTLLELFIERWSKPWNTYCEKNNLKWTGHYWEHEWPNPSIGPDNMAMYAWHQMPGIDILMNQYSESVHAQFGNVRAVKELASIANQLGKEQTLSETYGASGWDLTFEDMKRIADWEYVFGVNFINQHLSYVTIKGARKNDHPLSFSYHEPWWPYYKHLNDYAARMTLAMTSGKQVNRILVLEPTTTAWMYYAEKPNQVFNNLGQQFQDFIFQLEMHHIEYDLGSEDVIARFGRVEGKHFVIGQRSYDVLLFPPGFENLNGPAYFLIHKYLLNGGKAAAIGGIPRYIDGQIPDENLLDFREKCVIAERPEDMLDMLQSGEFRIKTTVGYVSHHRRMLSDGQIILLVNSSKTGWAQGNLQTAGKSVVLLNTLSGNIEPYPAQLSDNMVNLDFDLPPIGSMLLFIGMSGSEQTAQTDSAVRIAILPHETIMNIRRIAPNTLKLDYCDLLFDDNAGTKDLYCFRAADEIFRHFGRDGNPWNRAVQYKTNILDLDTFPEGSGFRVNYPFHIAEGTTIPDLKAVVERPGLWTVSVNGEKVSPESGAWWLDRDLGVYPLGALVHAGENTITLQAPKMTIHSEIESVYLTGDFSLESHDEGWIIGSSVQLEAGYWCQQGMPFYADGVAYSRTVQVDKKDCRYLLYLPEWKGVVAHITVNEKDAGIIVWKPYEMDITKYISSGENRISVTVYGSLKNLLGPHHGSPPIGAAWPANFETAPASQPPGSSYDVREYGMVQPFELIAYTGPARSQYVMEYKAADVEIIADSKIIKDQPVVVELRTRTPGAELFYTLDGSRPDQQSKQYDKPLLLNRKTSLKAVALMNGLLPGNIASAEFEKVNFRKADYKNTFSFKYTAGGEEGLFDGGRGTGDFNDGRWQGFEETDLDVTLELLNPERISKISAGFLQDIGSWIYFPVTVTFYVSRDGKRFSQAGHFTTDQIAELPGDRIKNITVKIKPQEVSHIRVIAVNIKTCPKGDPGEDGRAWVFVDEISVE